MEILLIPGLLVWSGAVFFGTRSAYREGRGPLAGPLGRVRAAAPAALLLLGAVGLAGGAALVLAEIAAIRAREGTIGGLYALGVVAGMAGAVALSAFLHMPRRSGG